jgi:hypothetical protein
MSGGDTAFFSMAYARALGLGWGILLEYVVLIVFFANRSFDQSLAS